MVTIQSAIEGHYATGYEAQRLERGVGALELRRTQDLLARYLPPPPARVVDIGGGPGRYASWLAGRGYQVDLLDIVPLHIEQARARFQSDGTVATAELGDARSLPFESESRAAALLMGPLYHLQQKSERLQALREAWRVLQPGGVLAAIAISRFASLIDGFVKGYINDPAFVAVVEQDLESGCHHNPTTQPMYFTNAYFHHPNELMEEVQSAGFSITALNGIEGPFWILQNFQDYWSTESGQEQVLKYLRVIESDPTLIGVSAHVLAVCRKP